MGKVPSIIPITDLRQDAAAIAKRVRLTREPVFVTQRGRSAMVIQSTESYEEREHKLELLSLLAQGDKEIAAGKGYDLDAVLAELDSLLAEG
jgi:prevent-host-death family protein